MLMLAITYALGLARLVTPLENLQNPHIYSKKSY